MTKPANVAVMTAEQNERSPSFELVCDMEDDVWAIRDFANVLARMAESLEEDDALPIQRLAWTIRDKAEVVEKRRGSLFRALHPSREHFAKVGWPSDATAA